MTHLLTSDRRAEDRTLARGVHERGSARDAGRAVLIGLFAIYLALLVWIVLWKLEIPYVGDVAQRQIKLVPFVATATHGPSQPAEIVANALLFVPFGVFLGMLARRPVWSVRHIIGVSLVLEIAQYLLAVGSLDLTDVIVNTAGGLIGLTGIAAVRLVLGRRTRAVVTPLLVLGVALALLVSGAFFASPLHYR